MIKNNRNVKTLLISLMTMLMCVALIAGATFAWFTDSISSGTNIIQSGKLKISATVHNLDQENGTETVSVQSGFLGNNTKALKFEGNGVDFNGNADLMSDATFEPGKIFVKMIRVKNEGNLAAKAKLTVNVQDDGLQDALWFAVKAGNSEAARAPMSGVSAALNAMDFVLPAEENAANTVDVVFAYGMNEEAGNEYQEKSFAAMFSIIATQASSEDATYPVLPNRIDSTLIQSVTASAETTIKDENNTVAVAIPANALSADTEVKFTVQTKEADVNSVTYDIALTTKDDAALTLASPVAVTLNIGKNLKNVQVMHKETPMQEEEYTYDAATGILTINTQTFSPFCITFETDFEASIGNIGYGTLNEAIAAAENEATVTVVKDIEVKDEAYLMTLDTDKTVTVDLKGKTLTYIGNGASRSETKGEAIRVTAGTLKIKNGAIDMVNGTDGSVYRGIRVSGNGDLSMSFVDVTSGDIGITLRDVAEGKMIRCSLDNCRIEALNFPLYQNGSTSPSEIAITNSTLISNEDTAVYISNTATASKQNLTIENSTIEGATAVEIKHTNAQIRKSKLVGTYAQPYSLEEGNGNCTKGYALAVTGNGAAEKASGKVEVTNSKFYSVTAEGKEAPDGFYFVYTLAEGASVTFDSKDADTTDTYGGIPYVARIGGSWYKTIADAITAGEGKVVTLAPALNNTLEIEKPITIPKEKNITLDGNGVNLKGTANLILVESGAKATIKNFTFTGTQSNTQAIFADGDLIVDGCKTNDDYTVRNNIGHMVWVRNTAMNVEIRNCTSIRPFINPENKNEKCTVLIEENTYNCGWDVYAITFAGLMTNVTVRNNHGNKSQMVRVYASVTKIENVVFEGNTYGADNKTGELFVFQKDAADKKALFETAIENGKLKGVEKTEDGKFVQGVVTAE